MTQKIKTLNNKEREGVESKREALPGIKVVLEVSKPARQGSQ